MGIAPYDAGPSSDTVKVMNKRVDIFIKSNPQWANEFTELRKLILEYNFEETLKWGKPTYRINNENILLLHGFKDYCAILFFKGSTLDDPEKLLVAQTPNVVMARQIRFTSCSSIKSSEKALRKIINQAKESINSHNSITLKPIIPTAISQELDKIPGLLEAFQALSPGKQRGYLLHFLAAKKPLTLTNRINNNSQKIFDKKSFN